MRRLWAWALACVLLAAAMGWGPARLAGAPSPAAGADTAARGEAVPEANESDQPQPAEPEAAKPADEPEDGAGKPGVPKPPAEEAATPDEESGEADGAKAKEGAAEASRADVPHTTDAKADEAETPDAPKDEPVDPEVQRLREQIEAHFERAEYLQARPLIVGLIRKRPEDPDAWYDLACVYSRFEKRDAALRCLRKAVACGFRDVSRIQNDESLEALREMDAYRSLIVKVRSLPGAKEHEQTARHSRRTALTEERRKIVRLHRQAMEQFKKKDYAKVIEILRKVLEADPKDATAHYNLACAQAMLGQGDEAMHDLTQAVEHGFTDFRHLEKDDDLTSLRSRPDYQALLARKDAVLRQRAETLLAELEEEFGEGYFCEVDHDNRLLFATNVDRRTLDDLRAYLPTYAQAQWASLFDHGFEQYVRVIIPKQASYRRGGIGGYYRHNAHMLVAKTIGMTLTHEFTHALHFADQDALGQEHPVWIAEGLATLFESSRLVDGRVEPLPNRRLNRLQRIVAAGRSVPFKDMVTYNHPAFMRRAGITYPQVRYMMMYMYDHGLLKTWYDAYTETWQKDKTGAQALERVLGKSLADIEADWKKWVMSLKAPLLRAAADQPFIGIKTQPQADGLKVVEVVPDSGAAAAGVRVGDRIIRFAGRRIVEPEGLIAAVRQHKIGELVNVVVRRRTGKYETLPVTLGAQPGRATQPEALPDTQENELEPQTEPQPDSEPQPEAPAKDPASGAPAKKAA